MKTMTATTTTPPTAMPAIPPVPPIAERLSEEEAATEELELDVAELMPPVDVAVAVFVLAIVANVELETKLVAQV